MKKKQCEKLCKQLLPQLPGYTCKGWLLYAQPLKHILRGFCFEGSSFDKTAFYVWEFFLPLYVPTKHVYFTFGKRLRGPSGERWILKDDGIMDALAHSIQTEGMRFLADVREPTDVTQFAEQSGCGSSDPYLLEAIAYSHLFANDLQQAATSLNRLLTVLDPSIGWHAEIRDRAEGLMATLESDPDKARQSLEAWESETIDNLGLGSE